MKDVGRGQAHRATYTHTPLTSPNHLFSPSSLLFNSRTHISLHSLFHYLSQAKAQTGALHLLWSLWSLFVYALRTAKRDRKWGDRDREKGMTHRRGPPVEANQVHLQPLHMGSCPTHRAKQHPNNNTSVVFTETISHFLHTDLMTVP